MKTVCELNKCAGCGACSDICPHKAIRIIDDLDAINAEINTDLCINCNLCQRVCQVINKQDKNRPLFVKQGWATNADVRKNAASGGLASALAKHFIEDGGVVCTCIFKEGQFVFDEIDDLQQLEYISGSRYVKSNPEGAYKKCKTLVSKGKKVLFIGLPCQVAAFKNYIPAKYSELIVTIDLICHGSPSVKLLHMFLGQYGVNLKELSDIQFRSKGIKQKYSSIMKNNVMDYYTIGFLNCLFYTENCYECRYADINRISDITLGDSWGSELPAEEKDKGISLILCQTEKGKILLDNSEVVMKEVDVETAIANNHQLKEPSQMPKKRRYFFEGLAKGKAFNSLVIRAYPVKFLKQQIKKILIELKLYSFGEGTIFHIFRRVSIDE